ncbi:MAG TPA: hypothetical protein PKC14_02010 [Candidatus Absconditabacterales bacterium]|nr:hypothetical protein [Candidatus Absconditabacterales bacterium]
MSFSACFRSSKKIFSNNTNAEAGGEIDLNFSLTASWTLSLGSPFLNKEHHLVLQP